MKKITLATIKTFIAREAKNGNLYIKRQSSFDGMQDMVASIDNPEFKKVSIDPKYYAQENTFGIPGAWFVKQSRDYFTPFSDQNFIGYEISNCCGSFVVAMARLY